MGIDAMPRIKVVIEYDGSQYHGFQRQKNARTIQEAIETAIRNLTGERVSIQAAGRTDTGVHALGQVIAFETNASIPAQRWALALNSELPADIFAHKSEEAPLDFHPRFSALSKCYRYKIYRKKQGRIIYRNYALCNEEKLNIEAMQKACRLLEGTHSFKAFCASGSNVKNYIRTVYSCELKEERDWLTMDIKANGFLYNMVRIIMGTLLEIGRNQISPEYILELFRVQDRSLAGPTASPAGLYLVNVEYPPEINLFP